MIINYIRKMKFDQYFQLNLLKILTSLNKFYKKNFIFNYLKVILLFKKNL